MRLHIERTRRKTLMTDTTRRSLITSAALVVAAGNVPKAAAQNAEPATDYEAFVRLSCVLTGMSEKELPTNTEQQDEEGTRLKLYEIYFQRIRAAYPAELRELLSVWKTVQNAPNPQTALAQKLSVTGMPAQRLRVAARQIVKIWYLSTIDDPRTALDAKGKSSSQIGGDIGQYQLSAIWGLIGAPVPGYSNFNHGYWAEKPIA